MTTLELVLAPDEEAERWFLWREWLRDVMLEASDLIERSDWRD